METIALENKRGFTLIELVIVIVLIGILAATALPKFANLTGQAQQAANQGVAGGLSAAVSVAHAAWLASGANVATTSVSLEGTQAFLNTTGTSPGFPSGAAAGALPSTPAHCQAIFTQVLSNAPSVLATAGACPSGGACYVATVASPSCTYTAQSGSTPYTAPVISITYNALTGTVTYVP